MSEAWEAVREWSHEPAARAAARALVIFLVGIIVARFAKRRLLAGPRGSERLLISRIVAYLILGLATAWSFSELGLSLGVLLGAAGVLTIAVGFAAQTAVSNLISGLFLLVERPFRLDDVIEVGNTTGEVVTIDLMSTKLRTFDNILVRIPNEVLLKAEVKNLTHFPIRRVDVLLRVERRSDLDRFNDVFIQVASEIPQCLDEPRPALLIDGFDDSGVIVKLTVWAASADHAAVKVAFQKRLTHAITASDLAIGVPERKMVA